MAFALGGMLVRMVLLLVVVLSAAMLVSLHVTGFAVALIAVVVVSLILEVVILLRRVRSAGDGWAGGDG